MSTDLAIRNNGWGVALDATQPEPRTPVHGVSLMEWVDQARQVAGVAEMLAVTSFVPKAFRGKAPEIAAAILAGQEVGMSPMAALRAIDVIEGKPGMSALALRALVQSHGHEIWVHESTATRAIVRGSRKGSDRTETSTWTLDRARQMGLAGKDNWKKQPTAMLLARATAEVARLVAADVLLGMPYSTEELADGWDAPESASVDERPAPKRRTARRATATPAPAEPPEPEPEPEFDEPAPVEPGPEPEELITRAQLTKLHTLLTKAGIRSRDDGLAYYSQVIGRDVASSKELTKAEACRVIDALEAPAEPPLDVDEPELDDEPWPDVTQPGDAE